MKRCDKRCGAIREMGGGGTLQNTHRILEIFMAPEQKRPSARCLCCAPFSAMWPMPRR